MPFCRRQLQWNSTYLFNLTKRWSDKVNFFSIGYLHAVYMDLSVSRDLLLQISAQPKPTGLNKSDFLIRDSCELWVIQGSPRKDVISLFFFRYWDVPIAELASLQKALLWQYPGVHSHFTLKNRFMSCCCNYWICCLFLTSTMSFESFTLSSLLQK